MASWSAAVAHTEAPPIEQRRRPRTRARRRRDPLRSGVVWIVAAAVVLAGLVALNVAVLQLNVRLDQLSRDRASLRDAERGARVAVLDREGVAADPGAREGAARPRAREADDVRGASAAASAASPPEPGQPQAPAPPDVPRRRLRRAARPGGVAAGRAGGLAVEPRGEAAPRDGRPARVARDDLRPDRRAARDRRAGDDRLRRPAAGARPARGRDCRGAHARRRCERALRSALEPEGELRLRRAQGRSRPRPLASRS